MAILPIELEPVEVLPDPSTNNRALVLYRGDLCYAYKNQWLRVVANRQAMGKFVITGYIFGGSGYSVAIQSFNMVTESASQISSVLPYGRSLITCIHSPVVAYIAGGYTGTGSYISQIASFRFYGEAVGVISATLSTGKRGMASMRDTSKGYLAGGSSGSSLNVIDKLVYSNESYGPISAVLSSARADASGIRSSSHGYTCGGNSTVVDKLSFSTETAAQTSSLQQSRNRAASGSIPTHGYIMAGEGLNTFEVWSFSTDTVSLKASVFSSSGVTSGGVNSYTKGYILYTMASGRIEGILYSTDTVFQTNAQMVSNLGQTSQASCQTGVP
jgi:hypothetical protein